jgi:hypothetical protein
MVGTDPAQLLLRRVGADTAEEDTHLRLPALEVGAQHRRLLLVGEFLRPERLRASPDLQLSASRRAQIANPVCHSPGRDEVAIVLVGEDVDGCGPPLAARATAHAQHAGSPDTEPGPGEEGDGRVADVVGEPAGTNISGFRFAAGHASVPYPGRQPGGPAGGPLGCDGGPAAWPGGCVAVARKQLAEYGKSWVIT